jgi:transmembrane sensor
LQALINQPHKTGRTYSLPRLFSIAASVIILLGIGWLTVRFISTRTIKTPKTESAQVILADGSHITLNAGSRLSYSHDFNKKNRIVRLTGEGYFEVAKNPDKPFIIRLGEAEVRVLGTSFNVKAYKGSANIEVTVTEGRVGLYDTKEHEKKVIATSGEKAEYNKNLKVVKKTVNNNANYIAWKTHVITFRNDRLSIVVNTLRDVYHHDFEISDQALSSCTITARFENKDLESVLRILESTLDVTIKEDQGKYVISGEGCN